MSKVTLETLKADFEDAAKSLWSKMQDGEGIEFAIRGTDQTHTFCLSSDS